jgi:phosphoribosylanthranilate isomerase
VSRLFVKICGMTRPRDVALAAELGANAVGFVFWPGSPRYVMPAMARTMVEGLPAGVMKVGVFVDEPVEEVARIMNAVGLDAAQLHGNESAEYCRRLIARLNVGPVLLDRPPANGPSERTGPTYVASGFNRTLIKAIAIKDEGAANIDEFDPETLLLIDAYDPARYGGTGRTVNWDSVRAIASSRKTILAGGLHPDNVSLAVETVRPFGVDVSSGVESAPGVKDPDRLKRFFEALHD